jgi:Uma2 family endonuclease
MTVAERQLMTAEQLDAMPDDGIERWLINGELREGGMTVRNRRHSRVEAAITTFLGIWNREQPEARGEVLVGEAGVALKRDPDTRVGIDVAYISAELSKATPEDQTYIEGAPTLAVEVLSPSDKEEDVTEKINAYLEAGVKLVWVVEPVFHTITVYRADAPPALFNETQTIDAEPHLPGFRVAVKEIFGR